MNKSDISALTLQWWMTYYVDSKHGRKENDLKKIDPIINRDGWYFNRRTKLEWYEYKGLAFLPRSGAGAMFLYTLKLLNAQVLTQREVAAYEEMLRLKPKKSIRTVVSEILDTDRENKNLRNIRMDIKLRFNSRKKNNGTR